MVTRKRRPGFGTDRQEKSVIARRPLKVGQPDPLHPSNIDWENSEMEELREKKRKAEEAEPYNKPETVNKSKLIAMEAARRSLGLRAEKNKENDLDDLGFELPSSTSPENRPVTEGLPAIAVEEDKENAKAATADPAACEGAEETEAKQRAKKRKQSPGAKEAKYRKPLPRATAKQAAEALGPDKWATKSHRAKKHARLAHKKRLAAKEDA